MHPNSLANLEKGKNTRFGARGDSAAKEMHEKSVETKAERKTFREGMLLLLNAPLMKDGKPTDKTTQDAIIAALVKKAAAGDTRAFEMIRDTIGEKPVQQVEVATPKAEMADDIAAALAKRQKDLMAT